MEIKLYNILPHYLSTDYTVYIIEHWKIFIDDCFIPLNTSENLELFEVILNRLHPSIKFTKEVNDCNIPFLDLVIKTNEGNTEMDIFYKKTNGHCYLYFESAHPRKTKRNISLTLAQRITKIVSNPVQQKTMSARAHRIPKNYNYSKGLVENAITRAKEFPKSNINITGLEKETITVDENYIRKHIKGVQTKCLQRAFSNTRIVFAEREPRNLKRLLTNSSFTSALHLPVEIGIKHCSNKLCLLCQANYLLKDKIISPVGTTLLGKAKIFYTT